MNINALELALQKIEEASNIRATVEVGGIEVTIRTILPEEDVEIQKWAVEAVEETRDQATFIEYIDRIKLGVLSYAIIAIGGEWLGDIIDTGVVLESGQTLKQPRNLFLRERLQAWARPLRHNLFRKHIELSQRLEIESESMFDFDPPDLDAEIERLKKRIEQLESKKAESDGAKEDARSKQMRMAAEITGIQDAQNLAELQARNDAFKTPEAPQAPQPDPIPPPAAPQPQPQAPPPEPPQPAQPGYVAGGVIIPSDASNSSIGASVDQVANEQRRMRRQGVAPVSTSAPKQNVGNQVGTFGGMPVFDPNK